MAKTTGAINAKDVNIKLDDENGAAVDISGSANEVNISPDQDLGEYGAFEDDWIGNLVGKKRLTVSLVAVYSSVEDEAVDLLKEWYFDPNSVGSHEAARTLTVSIPDSSAVSDQYSGEFKLDDLSIPSDAMEAGPIKVTATLQNDGAVSLTTVAS